MTASPRLSMQYLGEGLEVHQVTVVVENQGRLVRIEAWGSLGARLYLLYAWVTLGSVALAVTAPPTLAAIPILTGLLIAVLLTLLVAYPWLILRGTIRVQRLGGQRAWRLERVRGARGLVPASGLFVLERSVFVVDRVVETIVSTRRNRPPHRTTRTYYRAYAVPHLGVPDPKDVWWRLLRDSGLAAAPGSFLESTEAVARLAQLADVVWNAREHAPWDPLPHGAVPFGIYESNHIAAAVVRGIAGALSAPVIDTTRPPLSLAARVTPRARPIGLAGVGQLSLASPSAAPAGAVSLAEAPANTSAADRATGTPASTPLVVKGRARRRRGDRHPPDVALRTGAGLSPSGADGPRPTIPGIRRTFAVGSERLLLGRPLQRVVLFTVATFIGTALLGLIIVTVADLRASRWALEAAQLALTAAVGYVLSRPKVVRLDGDGFSLAIRRRRTISVPWREIRGMEVVYRGVLVTTSTDSVVVPARSPAHTAWLLAELEAWVAAWAAMQDGASPP